MDPTPCFELLNKPPFVNQNLLMEQLSSPIPAAKPRRVRRLREDGLQNGQRTRSSIYKGVTKHRWTGRYEAHLWDKHGWSPRQNKKGRQVYLGAYDDEETAAHTYDLAALKYWGVDCILNFPASIYLKEYARMQSVPKDMYIASLRRKSSGFSRGESKYRGVAKHHKNGRWEARIGRVYNNKYLYLGTFDTQEEAAEAYDKAVLHYRGANAVTNFDISQYSKPSQIEINHTWIHPFPLQNQPSENSAVGLQDFKLNPPPTFNATTPAVNQQPILPDLTEVISDFPGTNMSTAFDEFSHVFCNQEVSDLFSFSEADGFSGMQDMPLGCDFVNAAAPVDSTIIAPPVDDDFFKYMEETEAAFNAGSFDCVQNEALSFGSYYPFSSS